MASPDVADLPDAIDAVLYRLHIYMRAAILAGLAVGVDTVERDGFTEVLVTVRDDAR